MTGIESLNRSGIPVAQSGVNHSQHYMITERIALVMLDGELPERKDDPHYTRQFYKSIQAFANASLKLCDEGKFKKLEQFLKVAFRLFKEGNETVKAGIVDIYLYTLSHSLDQRPNARKWIEPFMPGDLRIAYAQLHHASSL
jgi:hypothetical protein